MYEKYFKNLKYIGSGRYSTIFKAQDIRNNKDVAIKEINKNNFDDLDYGLLCAKREIEITKKCQCENVIKFYENLENENSIILILELCDKTLEEYYFHKDLFLFQQFLIQLNNALRSIRKNKVMHRDIKPDNILIKIENEKVIPKLCDFGISRFYDEKKDYSVNYRIGGQHTGSIGTYYYIAPEIMKSEPYNHECDLFSLGVTLYESLFGTTPYGRLHGFYDFQNIINNADKLSLIKTGISSLDDLFERLLELDPQKRITFEEYFEHDFFKEKVYFLKTSINEFIYPKKKFVNYNIPKDNESPNLKKMNKINCIAKQFIDIMDLPNGLTKVSINEEKLKISNIIYYDENIEKHLEEIHNDCDKFEKETNGAFLLCTNINALKFTMIDIKEKIEKDHRIIFNLIVTGSKFQKVIDNLKSLQFEKYISSICIYCMKIDKYSHLKKKYSKIKGIYNSQDDVIKFIQKTSSFNIKAFSMTKVLTFHDYKNIYFQRHIQISNYYGDFTEETYKKVSNKLKNFIDEEKGENLKNTNKKEIQESFKTFDLDKDLLALDKMLIKEYTKNTLYGDLNNWLRTLNTNIYDKVSYYTARLMFSLNNYGLNEKKYFRKNITVFRGAKTKFTNLLPFERSIGKVIILSSFTSTSESEDCAKKWSGREKSKLIYNQNKKFSVIYKINNIIDFNTIPCGVNIQTISEYKENEILFQPFSFYYVKSVNFNYEDFTVDIELETLIKKEILEYKISKGKKVGYDKSSNLVFIEN